MSQVWRKVWHLRKGKALLKKVAKERIDWRIYDTEILVNHKQGKHINTITLIITTKREIGWNKYTISRTFNTESIFNTSDPKSVVQMEIQLAINELDRMTLSIPEGSRF
jgi:hypothetical protein